MSIQRHGTTRRYSDSVVYAGTVYLVEVPANLDADITAQTENLLASIDRLLAQAGSDKSQLLMVTIYLADMADYERLHRQQLAAFPHVARVRTAFAMRAVVPSRGCPL